MELISRQAAIDAVRAALLAWSFMPEWRDNKIIETIEQLPPIQHDIIYCKDCKKHNKGIGDIEEQPYGLRKHIMKDESCPLVSWRGKAQGHEFDYQFCVYGKRREVTT